MQWNKCKIYWGKTHIMVIFCSCHSPCPISLQTAVINLWWWSIRHKWHLLKRGLSGLTFIDPWVMSYWALGNVLHNIYRPIWGIASAALLKDLIVLLNSQMFCLRNRGILFQRFFCIVNSILDPIVLLKSQMFCLRNRGIFFQRFFCIIKKCPFWRNFS